MIRSENLIFLRAESKPLIDEINRAVKEYHMEKSGFVSASWDGLSVKGSYSPTYLNLGILDEYDHFLECQKILPVVLGKKIAVDLACGNGRFTEFLIGLGVEVTAVEREGEHISALKDRFEGKKVTVVQADALSFLKTVPEKYDLIIVSGLFLFLPDDVAIDFLRSLKNALNHRGCILIRDFFSRNYSIQLRSRVFSNTFLFYRPLSFYENEGFNFFSYARSAHYFYKVESLIARTIGYRFYKWLNRIVAPITWWPRRYVNQFILYENIS